MRVSPPDSPPTTRDHLASGGLLLMRLSLAAMMLGSHGWPKLSTFAAKLETFPDPLGVGSAMSLTLAVFAEFFCSIGLALGLFTRLAAVPLLITMLVAVLLIHTHDPWSKKEFALLYAVPYLMLIFTGPGLYSLDELIRRAWMKRRAAKSTPAPASDAGAAARS